MTQAPRNGHGVQGTAVAIDGRGVLLLGLPGVGKSELALGLIGEGAGLIADDLVVMYADAGRIMIAAPRPFCHHMVIRDIGFVPVPQADAAISLAIAIALDSAPRQTDRGQFGPRDLGAFGPIDDLYCPKLTLDPRSPLAVTKVRLALERWGH
ncbi:MAG: hypothetical protein ABL882_09480 [Sphingopyxis sp.]